MIKKIYLALALMGSLVLPSCDSFLDITPVGVVIPQTLDEYRSLLTTAYNFSTIDRSVCEVRTMDAVVRDNSYDQNSFSDVQKWIDKSSNPATHEFGWSNYYSTIYYANAILANKEDIENGSTEEINQIIGEAYLLRAYTHFNLVNLYGQPYTKQGASETKAVPLKLDLDLENVLGRNTVGEVYKSILDDISSARTFLNVEKWEERYSYRFTTLSADALESRVQLYMGNWDKAYSLSEAVLNVKSDLEDLNNSDSKLPNHYQSVEVINAYEKVFTSTTANAFYATPALLSIYDKDNDARYTRFFEVGTDTNLKIKKNDGSTSYRCSFRTAEYYLNSAEAAAHLNKLDSAKTRLKELIANRYNSVGYSARVALIDNMTKEQLISEILDERSRELAFEGHKWFDLRRTTRPAIEKVIDGATYTLSQDDPRYTLHIPTTAISSNPNLGN